MTREYCCPKCKSTISKSMNGLQCKNCHNFYLIEEGYVDFVGRDGFYSGEVSQQEMKQLIHNIDTLGYDEGVRSFLKKYPFLTNYLTDIRRIDWVCHALGKNNHRCLDIGSGLGNISENLSHIFQEVYSLDAVKERIEFQKRRYMNSNRKNITLVRGNALEIPFPDNYFDLIVCNGVLEWVGMTNYYPDPRKTQIKFLKEIKRVLSDKGCLYIGIENRFGLQFFRGAKDHSGLKYTSLMPRNVANFAVKRFGPSGGIYGDDLKKQKEKRGYYTYTYGLGGYSSLFRESGFNFKTYWVIPAYNNPILTGRIDDVRGLKSAIHFLKTTNTRFKKILSFAEKIPLPLLKFITRTFSPSFLFYCYKNDIQESIDEIITRTTKHSHFATLSGDKTIRYFLFDDKGKPNKIAQFQRFGYHLSDNLPSYDKTRSGESLPSERIWLESWIKGNLLNPLKLNEMILAIDWIVNFQNKTCKDKITKNDIMIEIDAVRKNTLNLLDKEYYKKWIDNYESYISKLPINRTAEHGDLWHGNVLVDSETDEITVIDWEFYNEKGNPIFDFISLIINGMLFPNNSVDEFQLNLKGKGKFSPILHELKTKIDKYFGFKLNLDILIRYYILFFITRKQLEKGPFDETVIRYKKLLDLLSENESILV